MPAESVRMDVVPMPTGSNPLWLEKRENERRRTKYLSLAAILVLIIATVLVVRDYGSVKDPNDSECKAGFAVTGCPAGYKCVGGLVKCEETNGTFKYKVTGLIFPEKKCKAEEIYREYCVKEEVKSG